MTVSPWDTQGQPRLDPADITDARLPAARLTRRGYDEDAVRRRLAQVRAAYARLLSERNGFWHEVQRLRRRIILGQQEGDSPVLFGADDAHAHAEDYCGRLTGDARTRHESILAAAAAQADQILAHARDQGNAAARAALEQAPARPPSQAEWAASVAQLASFRAQAAVYREHMRAMAESTLRAVDDWENREVAGLADAARTAQTTTTARQGGTS